MVSKSRISAASALLPALALALAPALRAQEGPPQNGSIEIGIRALAGDHNSSQFSEYRDIRPGLFIRQADLDLENVLGSKVFLTLQTTQTWQDDRHVRTTFGRHGKVTCEVRNDGTPHDFTNTAASFYTQSSAGVFTVSPALRTAVIANPSSITSLLPFATPVDVALHRNRTGGGCDITPTARWSFFAKYSNDAENGYRPLGATLNDETNVAEQMEPVNYRMHDISAGLEYANSRFALQAGYGASIFQDQNSALRWDNLFNATDAVGNGAHGQMSLYPDNSAQSLSFAAAWNLSKTTRLMASISPEWMRQNAAFLPMTVNTAVTNIPAMPAGSLNGRKVAIAANVTLTSHPLRQLSLNAHYRDYDYINDTPTLFFADYVYTDRQLDNLARQSLPYAFHQQTIGTSASWLLHKGESITAAYDFIDLARQHRDVAKSLENVGSITFDANPKDWFSFRSSYQHSDRNPQTYLLNLELYPKGGNPLMPDGWQMYDEAARIRNKGSALVQLDASDRLSFSAFYDTTQDRYNDSLYGLLGYRSLDSGMDISYQLRNGVSLFANYAYERYDSDQRARQYSKTNNTSNNDWESYAADAIHTFAGGVSVSRFRRHMTIDAFYSLSLAKGRIDNRILGNPALPGFLVTTAQDWPETSNRFHTLTGAVRYRLGPNVYSRLEYRWERYDTNDFQIQYMTPYMASFDSKMNTSLFLGATVPGYQVHILSASLEYRF